MKTQTHIGFWLIIAMLMVLVGPVAIPADEQYRRLQNEAEQMRSVFGDKVARGLVSSATKMHASLIQDTGVEYALGQGLHSDRDRAEAKKIVSFLGTGIADGANRYISALMMELYGIILRLHMLVFWCVVLAPFLIATVVDGFAVRAVRLSGFGAANPTAFALGMSGFVMVMAAPLLYVAAPLTLSPLFMPYWAVLALAPALLMLSHTQRVFTS